MFLFSTENIPELEEWGKGREEVALQLGGVGTEQFFFGILA